VALRLQASLLVVIRAAHVEGEAAVVDAPRGAFRGEGRAVGGHLYRVPGPRVIEPWLQVEGGPPRAAHHPDPAPEPVPVGRPLAGDRHEVVDLPDAVRREEPGD